MQVKFPDIYSPTFLANGNLLKQLYKKGKLPIKHGLYGGELSLKNVSNEHIKPKSYGGSFDLYNIALSTKENNSKRGNSDIRDYLTPEALKQYIDEIASVEVEGFDNISYIKGILKTLNECFDFYENKKISRSHLDITV